MRPKVVAASLFSTQSITADLAKINRRIKRTAVAPIDFHIGQTATGAVRALFPVAGLAGIQFNRQTGTAAFTPSAVPLPALQVVPGAVAAVAYGRYASPVYRDRATGVIPATGTLTGMPSVRASESLLVQMFIPAGPKPARGWPVAIVGHGGTDSMYGPPWAMASTLASQGIATVSINVVGHGGGAAGTLVVSSGGGAVNVTLPAGGRGIDQNGDGVITNNTGVNATGAFSLLINRDGIRQTVIDLMQLVRQIEAGVDIDGDGNVDLDAHRIYYTGQSLGGIYGTLLLATEPSLKAGVPNVPGGPSIELRRLSPDSRVQLALTLANRTPSLINLPPTPGVAPPFDLNFNANMPLRDQPAVIDTVPGAEAVQRYVDHAQWAGQSGNPVSYAVHIRKNPLPGHAAKPVIVQFAKSDTIVPNPTTSAILRAGELADCTTYFRHDLAYAANPALGKSPGQHLFLTLVGNTPWSPIAVAAQWQIATFFASGGATVIDPDEAGVLFEVPITGPLPEAVNFIP
jgi:dienelactone hydrolase